MCADNECVDHKILLDFSSLLHILAGCGKTFFSLFRSVGFDVGTISNLFENRIYFDQNRRTAHAEAFHLFRRKSCFLGVSCNQRASFPATC